MRLAGKSTIITGAGSGVGRASALLFAAEGARVICADLNADSAEATAREISKSGGVSVAYQCNVAEEADVIGLIDAAIKLSGRLDIMYNNAGIGTPRPGVLLEEHTSEQVERLIAVNLLGVYYGCKQAVLQFKLQGEPGVIVNTGSVAGVVSWGGAAYGATKGGVHQITRSVAVEGAPFGIRANVICPGVMPLTNFTFPGKDFRTDSEKQAAAIEKGALHPLGAPITAEDCAEAALFLASDAARNITGVLLPIDGGYLAR